MEKNKTDKICGNCEIYSECNKRNSCFSKWLLKNMPKLWRFIKDL